MRARNIKPGFYKNDDLAECSIAARYIAPGLWMMADKEGRLEDRPKKIKMEILPADQIDIEPLLQELADKKHIIRYEIAGNKYIQIVKFKEHQRPHHNEVVSTIPEAVITKTTNTFVQGKKSFLPRKKPLRSDSLTTDSLIPDSLNPESLPNGNSARVILETLSVDHNAEWLAKKRSEGRYLLHDENFVLEQFKQYCRSKGKKYANYLEAYRNAFEWERCQPKPSKAIGGNNPLKSEWTSAAERIIAEDRAAAERTG